MKKFIAYCASLCLSLSIGFGSFSDIGESLYKDDILQLTSQGVVEGFPGGLFHPDRAVTRAELLKITLEASDALDIDPDMTECFPDVPQHARYAAYVCNAYQADMIKWYGDGSFRPENPVLFSEGLKIALETFQVSTPDPRADHPWFDGYLEFVHNNTIFSKYNIYPESKMARDQMVHLVAAIINYNGSRSNVRDNRSNGCYLAQPSSAPTSVQVHGIDRSIITDIGEHYRHTKPAKLIIAFHGRTNPNTQVRGYYRIAQASDGNAILVYPSWLPEEWPTRSWADGGDPATAIRDYALFDKIVEEITENYCIDQDEIYAVGHSLGGRMTNNLACARGNILRGIGSVGGSSTILPSACTWPVNALIMHNPQDRLASFAGGEDARNKLLAQNKCDTDTYEALASSPSEGHCVQYNQCATWANVVWCPHTQDTENGVYYPHNWPSFAGSQIRNFFKNL